MRWLITVAVLLPSLAQADVEPRFAKLRDASEVLGAISAFTSRYVGQCGSKLLGGGDCEKNAELYRRTTTGKKFYMIITEESTAVLNMGEGNPKDGTFTLNLTPFFAGGDSAITHGAPTRTDSNGNPVLPFMRIRATLPDGWNMGMMARVVASRGLRLQIVFTPLGVWSLTSKGKTVKGVKARFDAVLVTVGRTGDTIGSWYSK